MRIYIISEAIEQAFIPVNYYYPKTREINMAVKNPKLKM